MAACATPPGSDTENASTQGAIHQVRTVEAGTNRAGDGQSDDRGSWNLFGLDDNAPAQSSIDGLRADMGTFEQRGTASWYGKGFHGRKTANGERFDMRAMTAAHPTLPLDSWVLVRNLSNNKVAVVRINDRGPYHGNRILDLSYAAAKRLSFVNTARPRWKSAGCPAPKWRPWARDRGGRHRGRRRQRRRRDARYRQCAGAGEVEGQEVHGQAQAPLIRDAGRPDRSSRSPLNRPPAAPSNSDFSPPHAARAPAGRAHPSWRR
jgi:rare lipoprotein A